MLFFVNKPYFVLSMSHHGSFIRSSKGEVYLVDNAGKTHPINPQTCPAARGAPLFPDAFIDTISKTTVAPTPAMLKQYCQESFFETYGKWLLVGGIVLGGGMVALKMLRKKGHGKTQPLSLSAPVSTPPVLPTITVPVSTPDVGEIPTL